MCWHKWSKWEIIRSGSLERVDTGGLCGVFMIQKRVCLKCGLTQVREDRT